MKNLFDILNNVPIFNNVDKSKIQNICVSLKASTSSYTKEEFIALAGDSANKIGIILAGSVQIISDDAIGYRTIIAEFNEGDIFGEVFPYTKAKIFPVSVISNSKKTEVLFLNSHNIISLEYECKQIIIENMLHILAQKNLYLNQKNQILSARSIREKLSIYFSFLAFQSKSNIIEIPFNRQGLADYLAVDRSAMSTEMGKMQKDGIIKYKKNQVEIIKNKAY